MQAAAEALHGRTLQVLSQACVPCLGSSDFQKFIQEAYEVKGCIQALPSLIPSLTVKRLPTTSNTLLTTLDSKKSRRISCHLSTVCFISAQPVLYAGHGPRQKAWRLSAICESWRSAEGQRWSTSLMHLTTIVLQTRTWMASIRVMYCISQQCSTLMVRLGQALPSRLHRQ